MTRLSYARVLIEVDLLGNLPSSINVVLLNGSPIDQQVIYESLPYFYKQCQVLGHTVSTCNKGSHSKRKKRPQDIHDGSGNPSIKIVKVEKGQPYSQGLPIDNLVNPMSTKVVTSEIRRHSSPGRKKTKLATSSTPKQASRYVHCTENSENMSTLPVTKHLTRSKASKTAANPCSRKQGTFKGLVFVHSSSDDSASM
ncbi:hypothetical protein NC653_033855 [Populus alba x Populus x berolinensis]|uniref:DUF4283 domain-containing protein n=1 Tax=Populus alba x Populus x berolinensis TaxID=444605 RepID=A0AAD6PZK8_9ROSI|nr:hypothetical protein NC653_033855 [Populus alba x Populus x berolinensis]